MINHYKNHCENHDIWLTIHSPSSDINRPLLTIIINPH